MKKKSVLLGILLSVYACIPEEDLPIKNMGTVSGYFIECYCKPEETFSLSAIPVLPISGNLAPDFSTEFDISIRANEMIKMEHVIFTLPGSDFIYKYGSEKKLAPGNDTLYLKIITPEKNQITAQTAVPEAIKIDSYQIKNNVASIHFSTSEDPTQNYYIYTLQLSANDSIFRKEVSYLNLSHYKSASAITRRIVCSQIAEADIAFISLMRITKDCYNYQISLNEANSANQGSITTPVPLEGNIEGALGIFTCYTEDTKSITLK